MRASNQEKVWGQVDKIGKGTKANYDPQSKTLIFCFKRGPEKSSELLRSSRELLMKELKELGYDSRMKYNGEVIVEGVKESDVVLEKKNHKLLIHLNRKQSEGKDGSASDSFDPTNESLNKIKFI